MTANCVVHRDHCPHRNIAILFTNGARAASIMAALSSAESRWYINLKKNLLSREPRLTKGTTEKCKLSEKEVEFIRLGLYSPLQLRIRIGETTLHCTFHALAKIDCRRVWVFILLSGCCSKLQTFSTAKKLVTFSKPV